MTNDLISRQDAIDAADRADYTGLAVEDVKKVTDEVVKELKKLPSAQREFAKDTNVPINDCISRQAAIGIFTQLWDCIGTIMDRDEWEDVCRTTANELPSATETHETHGVCLDDLIKRTDAIDAILEMNTENRVSWLDCVLDTLDALPSAQQWIPVSSGLLPEAEHGEGEDVLCQLENMRRIVLYFDGGNWCYPSGEPYIGVNYENGWSNKVVAWMPLPEPWKGEEE